MKKVILTKLQEQRLIKNENNFLASEQSEQDSSTLFEDLHRFFVDHLMIAHNLTFRTEAEDLIKQKVFNSSIDDFSLQLPLSIIERLSSGKYQNAADYFGSYQGWLQGKHTEKSKKAAKAPRPKRKGSIGLLIDELVSKNPAITEAVLLKELKKHVGVGEIDTINDTEIYGKDGQIVARSALRGRLSRAKEKFK
jgi:hypothetical protein